MMVDKNQPTDIIIGLKNIRDSLEDKQGFDGKDVNIINEAISIIENSITPIRSTILWSEPLPKTNPNEGTDDIT